ncbi:hypothetical protein [Owenweeksia hongkongensis]|uniref:hypothetical protein n=1 Tax=Owenweeksia hongkongensis TaxID=253245 RepID=UPI003A8EED9B
MQKWIYIIVLLILFPLAGEAQCAMCKAIAESSQAGGSSIADGLNGGIVYLMAFPYLLMAGVGYAIYRNKKSRT